MASERNILTRYEIAQSILKGMLHGDLIMNDTVFPNWIEETNCFWYLRDTKKGKEVRLVNAEMAKNEFLFSYESLVNSLMEITKKNIDHRSILLHDVSLTLSPTMFRFRVLGKNWQFEPDTTLCQEVQVEPCTQTLCSPDGSMTIFVRGHNLWVKDNTRKHERALTHDGTEDYAYARSSLLDDSPSTDSNIQAVWSPDSKRILTIQMDTRELSTRPIVNYTSGKEKFHPEVTDVKYPYPGDKNIETCRLIVIDIATGDIHEANYPPIPLVNCSERYLGFFSANFGWWSSADCQKCFFVEVTRGGHAVRVHELNALNGDTQVVLEETSETFVRFRQTDVDLPLYLPLTDSDELIWFSERSGWGHLYLYDLTTGEFKHSITEGEWMVRDLLHYDTQRRELLLQTSHRDPNISPYYRDICKVDIDTGKLTLLVSGCYEHIVWKATDQFKLAFMHTRLATDISAGVSPGGEFILTTRSRVDTVPESIVLDRNGRKVLTVETTDISGLPSDWEWPEPVKLKSIDDVTDIYGVIFRPPGFNPNKSYPVIDYFSSFRSFSSLSQGAFGNAVVFGYIYLHAAALAALGFIVVTIEGRGTPLRNKSFQDYNFGDPAFCGDLGDHIEGIKQLAEKYPYMDLSRVGITGIEAPTNAIYGILRHSDFYKVAVEHCLTDPPNYTCAQCETYESALFNEDAHTSLHYAAEDVSSFNGKLLLVQGMQSIITAGSMFRLVDALEKANKDFDMLCLPNLANAMSSYTTRREWDYHVKHLLNEEPPHEFKLTTGMDILLDQYASEQNS